MPTDLHAPSSPLITQQIITLRWTRTEITSAGPRMLTLVVRVELPPLDADHCFIHAWVEQGAAQRQVLPRMLAACCMTNTNHQRAPLTELIISAAESLEPLLTVMFPAADAQPSRALRWVAADPILKQADFAPGTYDPPRMSLANVTISNSA